MKCFLIGTKEISVKILEELLSQGHDVLGVYSEDHKESIKIWKEKLGHRSLKEFASSHNIPIYEKLNINSKEMISKISELNLDIIFSVQGGEILHETVLNIPKLGCFNLHTSLLPKNRGCFPMAWAIIENHEFAGFTIHKMLPGIDDGPIVSQTKIPISKDETGKTLYEKVMNTGFELFKETLPKFESLTYHLLPQNGDDSSYHPCTNIVNRGYPFGGQINPYWSKEKIDRFKRALTFPPFLGASPEPSPFLKDFEKPNFRVMLGFDCDRPRDGFIASEEGTRMAKQKFESINNISKILSKFSIPRTFFLCGHWLRTMAYKFGNSNMRTSLNVSDPLVEIADHSYSHNVVLPIQNRPDKIPLTPKQVYDEFTKNSSIFDEVLNMKSTTRGYRTPLGHFNGLKGNFELIDKFVKAGITYVSSDIRGPNDSLYAPLVKNDSSIRQPYRYENGLLEIPSIGWQDVVFSQKDYVSKFEDLPDDLPQKYDEILLYYRNLFKNAQEISKTNNRDIFVGLCLHPYDCSFYDNNGRLFEDLNDLVMELGGSFCSYDDVKNHFNENLLTK